MASEGLLHTAADFSAIVTFVIAAVAACYATRDYLWLNYLKKKELEKHLRLRKQAWVQAGRKGKRMFTALHLARSYQNLC